MHLAVPKHDVLVLILKKILSDEYIDQIAYATIYPLYILPISNSIFTSNNNIIFYVTTKDKYKKKNIF